MTDPARDSPPHTEPAHHHQYEHHPLPSTSTSTSTSTTDIPARPASASAYQGYIGSSGLHSNAGSSTGSSTSPLQSLISVTDYERNGHHHGSRSGHYQQSFLPFEDAAAARIQESHAGTSSPGSGSGSANISIGGVANKNHPVRLRPAVGQMQIPRSATPETATATVKTPHVVGPVIPRKGANKVSVCRPCYVGKIGCSRGLPCEQCKRKGITCVYFQEGEASSRPPTRKRSAQAVSESLQKLPPAKKQEREPSPSAAQGVLSLANLTHMNNGNGYGHVYPEQDELEESPSLSNSNNGKESTPPVVIREHWPEGLLKWAPVLLKAGLYGVDDLRNAINKDLVARYVKHLGDAFPEELPTVTQQFLLTAAIEDSL